MIRSTLSRALALGALTLIAASPARAQDASEIIDRMLEEYEARAQGIDDYTLVQTFMGFETVSYLVKEMEDGRPIFKLQNVTAREMDLEEPGPGSLDQIYAVGDDFKDKAEYMGRESVNGFDTHALEITDLEGTELGQQIGQGAEFHPVRGRLYLDTDSYVPRRMIFEGELTNDEGVHSVTATMELEDYRDHQGLLVAHSTVISVEGMGAAIDAEARAQFEAMERELENMSPEQRRRVEAMMSQQLEQFRAMMAGEDEPMVIEVRVASVRVNAGPPGED